LDLFEPDTLTDKLSNFVASPVSNFLKLWHNGFIRPSLDEKKAWAEHAKTDNYLTINEVRKIADHKIPNAKIQRHLFWRYSLIWKK
jgi:hypothetical protein